MAYAKNDSFVVQVPYIGAFGGMLSVYSFTDFPDDAGSWVHWTVAVSRDSNTGMQRLQVFRNGNNEFLVSASSSDPVLFREPAKDEATCAGGNYLVGAAPGSFDDFADMADTLSPTQKFVGSLDELRLWDTALDSIQISDNFKVTVACPKANLVVSVSFDAADMTYDSCSHAFVQSDAYALTNQTYSLVPTGSNIAITPSGSEDTAGHQLTQLATTTFTSAGLSQYQACNDSTGIVGGVNCSLFTDPAVGCPTGAFCIVIGGDYSSNLELVTAQEHVGGVVTFQNTYYKWTFANPADTNEVPTVFKPHKPASLETALSFAASDGAVVLNGASGGSVIEIAGSENSPPIDFGDKFVGYTTENGWNAPAACEDDAANNHYCGLTVTLWVKRSRSASEDTILSQTPSIGEDRTDPTMATDGFLEYANSFSVGYTANDAFSFSFAGDDVDVKGQSGDAGVWVQWTATFRKSDKSRAVYRNGMLQATKPARKLPISKGKIIIGSNFDFRNSFAGTLDEVRIFSAAGLPNTDAACPPGSSFSVFCVQQQWNRETAGTYSRDLQLHLAFSAGSLTKDDGPNGLEVKITETEMGTPVAFSKTRESKSTVHYRSDGNSRQVAADLNGPWYAIKAEEFELESLRPISCGSYALSNYNKQTGKAEVNEVKWKFTNPPLSEKVSNPLSASAAGCMGGNRRRLLMADVPEESRAATSALSLDLDDKLQAMLSNSAEARDQMKSSLKRDLAVKMAAEWGMSPDDAEKYITVGDNR